jgi:AcrR family transcriptional regulator
MSRPRSRRAHDQVLDAAMKLFAAGGIDATSMDAIAEASGVSKATIYKHWPDKDALCVEVMARLTGRDRPPPVFDSGDLRNDMIAALSYQPPTEPSDLRACIMPHLVAYASRNPAVGQACRQSIFGPPRAALTQLLDRGIASGQFPRTLDRDLALALLLGPMMYGHMIKRLQGKPPSNLPERIVDAFWNAHATETAAKRRVPRARNSMR